MNILPISPPNARGGGREELPAYLSNGVIGLRVGANPLPPGMALLSGYTGLHPIRQIEAAAVAPYPIAADIAVDNVWLSSYPQGVTLIDQAYDFSNGELTTRLSFAVEGKRINIEVITFCCRHQPTLVVQEIRIRADSACALFVRAFVDTHHIRGRLLAVTRHTPAEEKDACDGSLCWESDGAFSTCGIALSTELLGAAGADTVPDREGYGSPLMTQYKCSAARGRLIRLRQLVSVVPSAMHAQPDRHAERLVALGAHSGFEKARAANRAEWQEIWKGRINLKGAGPQWQSLADAAFFYLNTSVHTASSASTSMFGLATWYDYHYYYGHVMWDIETFSLPPLMVVQPEAAKSLLEYRSRNLAGARQNAQSFGRRGLQFPWESTPSSGQEATPSPGTAAWHEDHASLDVALAFAQFAYTSGDRNFLADQAWPVLAGVSEWITSRVHRGRVGYEIRRSMGIAERKKESDNDAYTMLAARAVLGATICAAEILGRTPDPNWRKISERLHLPIRDRVLVAHSAYRTNEEKGATPGPLMGVFPLWSDLDEGVRRRTLDFYLEQWKDYIGSPMLSSLYGVWAAWNGKRGQSLHLLEEGYAKFTTGRFLQTLEYRPDRFPEQPKAGPFFANMGGFLISLIFGFPRIKPSFDVASRWPQADVVLPEGWKEIEIERLWLQGRRFRLTARHGARATLEPFER